MNVALRTPDTLALARLRRRMEDAVERLIEALDAMEAPYVDLEPDADAEPDDSDTPRNAPHNENQTTWAR